MKGLCNREELDKIATEHKIHLQIEERATLSGWVGQIKGILQVLWERKFEKGEDWKTNKHT